MKNRMKVEGMKMLKKLFGKKTKQENDTGKGGVNHFGNGQMSMPPMNDFYHDGRPVDGDFNRISNMMPSPPGFQPPFFPNGIRNAAMGVQGAAMDFPGVGMQSIRNYQGNILPHMSNTSIHQPMERNVHEGSIEKMELVLPEQMVLYQHKSLQEKFINGKMSPEQSVALQELEKSRELIVRHEKNQEDIQEKLKPNGFERRLQELEGKEIYGVRVNGQNYGYHFGFHDPKCEIPAYQKEKAQMNHVKIGKMSGRVVALHAWCDEKGGELQKVETIYARLEKIDALILYASQAFKETIDENEWKMELISEQQGNSFKLHTLNETYLLEEIQCESNIFGQIQVDYKIVGMGSDDVVLEYIFKQTLSGEKAKIQKEKLKIYIPVDKIVSIETK